MARGPRLGSGGGTGMPREGASSSSNGAAGEDNEEDDDDDEEEEEREAVEAVEDVEDAGAKRCARGWPWGARRPRAPPQQPNAASWRVRRTARSRQLAAAQAMAIASTTTASPVSTTTMKIEAAGGGGAVGPPDAGPTEASKAPISALRAATADADADASELVSPR